MSFLILILVLLSFPTQSLSEPQCVCIFYCRGEFLKLVQLSGIFRTPKIFIDQKMKYGVQETYQRINIFLSDWSSKNPPTQKDIAIAAYDLVAGTEREYDHYYPQDWQVLPSSFKSISEKDFRDWAKFLNEQWIYISQAPSKDAYQKDGFSIIWTPNPFIRTGGNVRESYYWDHYWIVLGLLHSEMVRTARFMVENLLHLAKTYKGYIPGGFRIYYLGRSQPPVLIPTLKIFFDFTKDLNIVKSYINLLYMEFNFWMKHRTRTIKKGGKKYVLAHYGGKVDEPRPEFYTKDYAAASVLSEKDKDLYSHLNAVSESGWDLSSRWYVTSSNTTGNMSDTKTKWIIPVDLNAFIYQNAVILADLSKLLKDYKKEKYYRQIAENWLEAIMNILWHEDVGVWLDYDWKNSLRRNTFYASNLVPLFTKCYTPNTKERIVKKVLGYIERLHILKPGGVPCTFTETGEVWDYPYAIPIIQHMIIVGLKNTEIDEAKNMATKMCKAFLQSAYKVYDQHQTIFRKYDVRTVGGYDIHEYLIQGGYGASNGAILDLLNMFYGGNKHVFGVQEEPEKEVLQLITKEPEVVKESSKKFTLGLILALVALALAIALYVGILCKPCCKKPPFSLPRNIYEKERQRGSKGGTLPCKTTCRHELCSRYNKK